MKFMVNEKETQQTAKERRLARRAAERAAKAQEDCAAIESVRVTQKSTSNPEQVHKQTPKTEKGPGLSEEQGPQNAKERRLARRAAARQAQEVGFGSQNQILEQSSKGQQALSHTTASENTGKPPELTPGKNKRKREKTIPCIVFVGQLSYSTTAEQVEEYFRSNGIEGTIKVRLRTDSKTNQSKGMAFVELGSPSEMYKCLTLHHSTLSGRRINVEKSCGGKDKTKKKSKISQFKEGQTKAIETTIRRIIQEFTEKGALQPDEFDDSMMEKLVRYEGKTIEEALEDYIGQEKSRVHSRTGLFVATVKAHAEAKAKEEAEKTKAQQKNRKAAAIFGHLTKRKIDDKENTENGIEKLKKKAIVKKEKQINLPKSSSVPFPPPQDFSLLFPSLKGRGGGRFGVAAGRGHGGRGKF